MKITNGLHEIQMEFEIIPAAGITLKRFANSYLVTDDAGRATLLIDAGIRGFCSVLQDYAIEDNIDLSTMKSLCFTHSHPDHIGGAYGLLRNYSLTTAAHVGSVGWIENVGMQKRQRPVPGFDELVEGAVPVQRLLQDGDVVGYLGRDPLIAVHTSGHAAGHIAIYCKEQKLLISGDALPLPGQMPIYDHSEQSMDSIQRLLSLDVETLCLSWGSSIYKGGDVQKLMQASLAWVRQVNAAVCVESPVLVADGGRGTALVFEEPVTIYAENPEITMQATEICSGVARRLGLPRACVNSIFARTVAAHLGNLVEHACDNPEQDWDYL